MYSAHRNTDILRYALYALYSRSLLLVSFVLRVVIQLVPAMTAEYPLAALVMHDMDILSPATAWPYLFAVHSFTPLSVL
jgi:hypothetical protein